MPRTGPSDQPRAGVVTDGPAEPACWSCPARQGYFGGMRVHNHAALASTPSRAAALAMAEAALEAIDTAAAVRRAARLDGGTLFVGDAAVPLDPAGRVFLVAVGKCAAAAAAPLAGILGAHLSDGIVLDVTEPGVPLRSPLRVRCGTHPMPSEANVAATREIVALLEEAGPRDLVVFVISGGGSTLLCLPPEGGSAEAESALLAELFRVGATIQEINTVRKHTSLARGGFLAVAARPARIVTLVFSDVPGAGVDFVASGPTGPDQTTVADAELVLARYGLSAAGGRSPMPLVETPKDPALFDCATTAVLVSNDLALAAMAATARGLGFTPTVRTATLGGEARAVAAHVAAELHVAPPCTALLYGGETTVTVRGRGRGGRNLELALAALAHVAEDELLLTLASDGRDNGDLAGAVADARTRRALREARIDLDSALADNDSYGVFERIGHALETGATGANVADLIVALKT